MKLSQAKSCTTILALAFCFLVVETAGRAAASGTATSGTNHVEELIRVQQKIQSVVRQRTNAVVAVTDGVGYGSGVVVSESGLVLTAGHVLTTGGTNYRVIFPDGREAKAKWLGKNLNVDAGMVQITEPGPWPFAELGDASHLSRGQWCVCLGHSGGYELGRKPPVRAGRVIKFEPEQLITDCALIGGDSGGPLFDLEGRVIGIHSSIGSSIAENRHVTIATFRKHWDRMASGETWGVLPELDNRDIPQASLGIRVDRAAEQARILLVHPGGAAEAAGLKPGDIVDSFDSIKVMHSQHLIDLISQRKPGEQVRIQVQRGDDQLEISAELGTRR